MGLENQLTNTDELLNDIIFMINGAFSYLTKLFISNICYNIIFVFSNRKIIMTTLIYYKNYNLQHTFNSQNVFPIFDNPSFSIII